jgi:hypothetical protein
LTSVGSLGTAIAGIVGLGTPKGAVDVGGLEFDLIAGKSAAGTIVGLVALKVDVKSYAAIHTVTESSASLDVVGIELFVSQVRAGLESSSEIDEDRIVTRRDGSENRSPRKGSPVLPLSDSLVTTVLLVMNKSCY